jgi:hypothetical protein
MNIKLHAMKQLFTLLLFAIAVQFANAQQRQPIGPQNQEISFPSGGAHKNSAITYKFIPAPSNTWGYDIFVDERLMIHQTSVPGLPGNEGFKTKEQAKTVAGLVIAKIQNGEMPPSVTKEEMLKLHAL